MNPRTRMLNALSELARGRHNIAHDILSDGLDPEQEFEAARALNWIELGQIIQAKVLLAKTIAETHDSTATQGATV